VQTNGRIADLSGGGLHVEHLRVSLDLRHVVRHVPEGLRRFLINTFRLLREQWPCAERGEKKHGETVGDGPDHCIRSQEATRNIATGCSAAKEIVAIDSVAGLALCGAR
jgi:hypothetical protein